MSFRWRYQLAPALEVGSWKIIPVLKVWALSWAADSLVCTFLAAGADPIGLALLGRYKGYWIEGSASAAVLTGAVSEMCADDVDDDGSGQ